MIKSFVWNWLNRDHLILRRIALFYIERITSPIPAYYWSQMDKDLNSCFRAKVGTFSWVLGYDCKCGANLSPAFVLDMTGLIFKTGGRHLHTGSARQPVVVWLTLAMALLHNSLTGLKHSQHCNNIDKTKSNCRKRPWNAEAKVRCGNWQSNLKMKLKLVLKSF